MPALPYRLQDGPYRRVDAEQLAPRLDRAGFLSDGEGSVIALDAGTMALPPVRCHVMRPAGSAVATCRAVAQTAMPIQRPVGMPDQGPGFRPAVRHPPLAVTRLRDVVCIPGGVMVRDGVVLTETFSAPWEAYQHRHMTAAGDNWHLVDRGERTRSVGDELRGPVLFLDHQHLDWFGHVLLDLLAPAWAHAYCRAYLGLRRLPVLCTRPTHGFVQTLIEAAGIARDDIAFIDRPVRCAELIVATKALQIQHYVAPPAAALWARMRDRIAPGVPSGAAPVVDRLYVSRRLNPTRRLVEEPEVEHLFARHGFTVIHPERLDLHAQIRLFAGARLIAGCSGSNMFNLAFQGRAEAILVLVSPLLVHYSEQFLHATHERTATLDVVMGFTRDDELAAAPGNVHAPWHVDPMALANLVASWVGSNG